VYLAYSFHDAATDCFRNATALDPKDFRWPYLLAASHQAAGRLDEAVEAFGKALELAPEATPGYVHLGEIRLLQGRFEDAEAALRKALPMPAARALLGQVALARRDFKAAVEHLQAALETAPEANRLHHPLALAYRGLGDRAKAEEHLGKAGAVGLRAADPLLDEVAALRLGERVAIVKGKVAAQAGRYADAAAEFRRALAAKPESVEARVNLGAVLGLSGDRAGAAEQFREALRLDPRNATAHFNLGSLLAEGSAPGEAIPHLEAAAAGRPKDAEARGLLARALRDAGQPQEALEQYAHALELAPGDETARLGQAETLVRLQRYGEARRKLEEGLRTIPGSGVLSHALARLLAACPDRSVRDGARALELALAVWKARPALPYGETVAMAYAELERCGEAAEWQRKMIEEARRQGMEARTGDLARVLAIYEKGSPCRP
ncbi:MAG TPA: tetratricopeptide repeat protein, partial [Thermoanaerobaculia bacterium]|nr:tetratricopeptide repeat protein [Thermoanaerobaculia bacterium]